MKQYGTTWLTCDKSLFIGQEKKQDKKLCLLGQVDKNKRKQEIPADNQKFQQLKNRGQ